MRKKNRNYFIAAVLLGTAFIASCPNPDGNNKKPGTLKDFSAGPVLEITAGDKTISYAWVPSDPAADSYDLCWIEGDFSDVIDVKDGMKIIGAVSGGTIEGMDNDCIYSFAVRANKKGYNPVDSAVQSAMPASDKGPAENFSSGPVLEITAGDGTISYSWTEADPAADSYDLYWREGDFTNANSVKAGTKLAGAVSGGIIDKLANNSVYSVVVRANKEGYASIDSAVQSAMPVSDDGPPENFNAGPVLDITAGDGIIDYSWTESDPAADSYNLYWIDGDFTNATDVKTGDMLAGAVSGGTINDLVNNCIYSVVIRANKEGYASIDSAVQTAMPRVLQFSFTAAPELTLTGGYNKITVSWTNSEPAADSYDLYWREGTYATAAAIKLGNKVTGASSGYEISGLAEQQTCSVVVTANKNGYRLINSEAEIEETLLFFDPNEDYTGPGNITFSSQGITITWDAVAGANSYEIWRSGSRLGAYALIDTVTSAGTWTDPNPNPVKYENYYKIVAKNGATTISEVLRALEIKVFGTNTYFYDSKYDAMSAITGEINNIHDTVTGNSSGGASSGHWTSNRYAFYFKPGSYNHPAAIKIGFYTSVHGLGPVPTDTKLLNAVHCPAYLSGDNGTQNFWRSIENLSVQGGTFTWSVSQAAPARRMHTTVATIFQWNNGWVSGGFISDSYFGAAVGSQNQQQFYARNCHFNASSFSGVDYNKTVQGSSGFVDATTYQRSKVDTTPVIREKPFLYFDSSLNEYMVFVPALRRDAVGITWKENDIGEGQSLVLVKDFYIAKPGIDTAATLNAALDSGKHIYFLPGMYELSAPLRIKNPNTILLGSGYATLIPASGNTYGAIFIDDVDGVTVASLMLDAQYSSTYLICAGEYGANNNHYANPTLLADIFMRIGGLRQPCNADISALINSNNVIGDHFWAWRADHGVSGTTGWTRNTTKNGVVVTGDDVTLYGLFVEHYHEHETLWLGENGRTYFYQNERPYDVPVNTDKWRNTDTTGWAAYKVANTVNNHYAIGLGMYNVFSNAVWSISAMQLPHKPGVSVENISTLNLTNNGGQRSIINGAGPSSSTSQAHRYIRSFVNGVPTGVSHSGSTTAVQPPDETYNIPTNLHP
ncbi:MAG: hypothetical protein FWH41_00515 [Treponema sp.]|nr:hypothetical protein [Treponema sp.]